MQARCDYIETMMFNDANCINTPNCNGCELNEECTLEVHYFDKYDVENMIYTEGESV